MTAPPAALVSAESGVGAARLLHSAPQIPFALAHRPSQFPSISKHVVPIGVGLRWNRDPDSPAFGNELIGSLVSGALTDTVGVVVSRDDDLLELGRQDQGTQAPIAE